MNREVIQAFIAFLESASEAEIQQARQDALAALEQVSSTEGRADVGLCLRLIDEEILARLELARNGPA